MTEAPQDDTTRGAPRQVVHSADAVALELPLAGPSSRILAYALDAAILYGTLLGALFLGLFSVPVLDWLGDQLGDWVESLAGGSAEDGDPEVLWLPFLVLFLIGSFSELLYFTFWETVWNGSSPGKRLMGLQVLRDGGLPIDFGASILRNVLRMADALPATYLVGFVTMLVQPEGKRLGDVVAGTVVIRHDRGMEVRPLQMDDELDEPRFSLGREHVARLGREGRALVRQTLRRVESLTEDQRELALERSVVVLCERIGFEQELDPQDRLAFLRALWRASRRA